MRHHFVISTGVYDRIVERFYFRHNAQDFVRAMSHNDKLVVRSLDVQTRLWAVHVRDNESVFCFTTEDKAKAFIDLNISADLQAQRDLPEQQLFCAMSLTEQLLEKVQAIRDQFSTEQWFVLSNNRRVREWKMSAELPDVTPA